MRAVEFTLAPLGLLLLVLAAIDGWKWGIGLAVSDIVTGVVLAHCVDRTKKRGAVQRPKVVSWAWSALPSVASVLFWYSLVVTLVHVLPASHRVAFGEVDSVGFPVGCPAGSINCVRLGNGTDTHGADGLKAPHMPGSKDEVWSVVKSWVERRGGRITSAEKPFFLQATFVTLLMGYEDDFAVLLHCAGDDVVVNVQSQSRIGKSDLGVNLARVTSLLEALDAECDRDGASCSSTCAA